jgi:hypothetical protein
MPQVDEPTSPETAGGLIGQGNSAGSGKHSIAGYPTTIQPHE